MSNHRFMLRQRLITALAASADREELVRLIETSERKFSGVFEDEATGGFIYGGFLNEPESVVASYNNTRKDEQAVIEWFERALMGLRLSQAD